MIRNPEFLLRTVADTTVVVPVGSATVNFPGMISMNETGAWLWEQLATDQTVDSLVEAMTQTYDVQPDRARADVQAFVNRLLPTGAILEEA